MNRRPRSWLVLALVVVGYLTAVAAWVGTDRRARLSTGGEFSTFNTSPSGCSLALRYLVRSRRGVSAERLTRAVDSTEVPRDAVIFRIAPRVSSVQELLADEGTSTNGPASLLTAAEEEWLEQGGRLVLALDRSSRAVTVNDAEGEIRKVFPLWPELKLDAAPARRAIAPVKDGHSIFTIGDQILIARRQIGRGDIIFVAAPEFFQNRHLQEAGSLSLLATLAAQRPVLFDEVIHGVRTDAGILELMKRWGLGPFLLLLLLSFLARLWRSGHRLGAPDADSVDSRSEAVDMTESIGALYRKALSRRELLAMYERSFTAAVAHHTSLRGDELHARVGQMLGQHDTHHGEISHAAFKQRLARINEGFGRLELGRHR